MGIRDKGDWWDKMTPENRKMHLLGKRVYNPDDPDRPVLRSIEDIEAAQAEILATIHDMGKGITQSGGVTGKSRPEYEPITANWATKGQSTHRNNYGWALRNMDDMHAKTYEPHELIEKFFDYSEWVQKNPLMDNVLIPKTGKIIQVPKIRAMSIKAFCLWIGVTDGYILGCEKLHRFQHTIAAIRSAIYTQKFEYASAGLLNAAIAIRDLGLSDNVSVTQNDFRKTVDDLFPSIDEIQVQEAEIIETKELPYVTES